jgi:hypothetical protein
MPLKLLQSEVTYSMILLGKILKCFDNILVSTFAE